MTLDMFDQPTKAQILPIKKTPRQALRIEWALFTALSLAFLVGGFVVLSMTWQPDLALRWLALSALVVAYLLRLLWKNLIKNHCEGEEQLLPDLGWGNRLTLLRGVLVAGIMGFLILPRPEGWLAWVPGILFTLSSIADIFDGFIARVTNHATRLGEILDMSLDGLGVLAASVLVVLYGQAPVWYLLVGSARYIFLAGEWLRRRLGKPNYPLPPSLNRRVFASLQMGFLAVALWPLISPPGIHVAATLFGLPLLVGFGRDWLYVSGVLKINPQRNANFQDRMERWLPVGLRIIILVVNLGFLTVWITAVRAESLVLVLFGLLNLLSVVMLVIGILPRLASIMALLGLGFAQILAPLTPLQILLAVVYIVILYVGSGTLSLWTPDDNIYQHRASERPVAGVRQT
jgi:CDP-diacylglycerol--glycerol-3-phosphate 3-phosphatidyltransferase